MAGPSAALTAKPASSHSSQGTYAAKLPAPVSDGGKTDPCPHTHGRSITWDVWRTQRAFALQFGIPKRRSGQRKPELRTEANTRP
jgi:hypothetical protein